MDLDLVSSCLCVCLAGILWRVSSVVLARHRKPRPTRRHSEHCHLAVFLGSGGHTSEALMLLSALDFDRYSPRTYVISEGDALSARKATALELSKAANPDNSTVRISSPISGYCGCLNRTCTASCLKGRLREPYTILTIPRARRVHQPIYTTPVTATRSLLACIYHVTLIPLVARTSFADVLVLNGPGTCFILCLAVLLNQILGIHSPRVVYVESFARVRSLSLSGKLLRPLVDRFVVQWPGLLEADRRGECLGWLV
ncbi:glycosyltransferase family 1 protein [Rhodofomes roseus]|uniref:UDP-N-acetylglucosamine transferase subunit ALG14 n=1 Tax=Rhodofomes roseus TaxID=34475 RepID=A0ABQ8KNT4_9APHY|nr:glycosyltransferase family 1 protein [Rhodofomes roseus]KAH9839525.1 glycosyltransferase family 1 protein [Rhodofomes roseus]